MQLVPTSRVVAILLSISAMGMIGADLRAEAPVHVTVDSPVIASRGEASVTQADFDVFIDRVPENERAMFVSSPQRLGDVLHRLLRARQVFARATGEGTWDEPVAAARLYQGLIMAGADYYLNQVVWPEARLGDYEQQARELFLTRPDLVRLPMKATFSAFFVAAEPVRSELDAIRSIINVYDLLLDGEDFEELIEQYSESDTNGAISGLQEDVPVTDLGQELATMLRNMPEGEISQPFRTAEGWRIVQLHNRYRPEANRFEDVAEVAKRVAERRHRDSVRERLLRELSAQPVVFEENAIADLLARYGGRFESPAALEAEIIEGMGEAD